MKELALGIINDTLYNIKNPISAFKQTYRRIPSEQDLKDFIIENLDYIFSKQFLIHCQIAGIKNFREIQEFILGYVKEYYNIEYRQVNIFEFRRLIKEIKETEFKIKITKQLIRYDKDTLEELKEIIDEMRAEIDDIMRNTDKEKETEEIRQIAFQTWAIIFYFKQEAVNIRGIIHTKRQIEIEGLCNHSPPDTGIPLPL